jgi:hypothetical protein
VTSPALAALAPHFFQVAYVVRDLSSAEGWFQKVLGVPSWFRMENVTFGADCSFRGGPSVVEILGFDDAVRGFMNQLQQTSLGNASNETGTVVSDR